MLKEYSYGSKEELDQILSYYANENITILYEMKESKISLCRKIKENLNQARIEVA